MSNIKYHLPVTVMFIFLAAGLAFSLGCERQQHSEFSEQLGVEDYGRLPGLRSAALEKLQDELARVVEQGGTPEQIDGLSRDGQHTFSAAQEPSGRRPIPDKSNVASGLADAFSKKTFKSLKEAAEKHYPRGRFQFNALQLRTARGFLQRHRSELRESRDALKRPHCDFGFKYVRGFANDCSFIDRVRLAGRLEGLAAAEALFLDDDPRQAIDALQNMLQWARLLGAEKHVTARLQAGLLRAEALEVLQAIVLHPGSRREQLEKLEKLHALVHENLSAWPADADAWTGDRALGMHSYEVVRDGCLDSLLTDREVEEFTENGSLEELSQAAMAVVDRDELFYLGAMRTIIAACERPYYQRAGAAGEILAEAEAKADSPDYPLVAARLLLPGIDRGLRMQAEDRAAVEAWAAGLDAALDRPIAHETNPVTGKRYKIGRRKDQVSVLRPGDDEQKNPLLTVPVH